LNLNVSVVFPHQSFQRTKNPPRNQRLSGAMVHRGIPRRVRHISKFLSSCRSFEALSQSNAERRVQSIPLGRRQISRMTFPIGSRERRQRRSTLLAVFVREKKERKEERLTVVRLVRLPTRPTARQRVDEEPLRSLLGLPISAGGKQRGQTKILKASR
jgi:hypothetical protein